VVLPVTVIVNGQQIVVDSPSEYQTVQNAIDAFSNDDDIVNFIYPITVQFQNFSTQVVQDADDLDDILDDCDDDDGFDEISCISINYPISISIYDADNQLAQTVTIQNNTSLINFLNNLGNNVFIAINYPISVVNSNGQTVVITSNNQLENFIEDSIGVCNNSSGNIDDLSTILTSGTWFVSYYFEDDDETTDYAGYVFTFNSGGTISVLKSGNTTSGTWSNFLDSGVQKLDLTFSDDNLDDLEEDWRVIEYNSNLIKLKDGSGDDAEYLYFSKN
jgi:glycosyltransferase involved in cell wall biosynthesis